MSHFHAAPEQPNSGSSSYLPDGIRSRCLSLASIPRPAHALRSKDRCFLSSGPSTPTLPELFHRFRQRFPVGEAQVAGQRVRAAAQALRPVAHFLLRARERRSGRVHSLFFWRDRTREVDFVVDIAGQLELFEAKWAEVPVAGDAVNLDFVRNVVGNKRIAAAAIVCRAAHSYPLSDPVRILPVIELS